MLWDLQIEAFGKSRGQIKVTDRGRVKERTDAADRLRADQEETVGTDR